MYFKYKNSLSESSAFIGEESFCVIVNALTRHKTFNQELSYFYVDHINLVELMHKLVDRLTR